LTEKKPYISYGGKLLQDIRLPVSGDCLPPLMKSAKCPPWMLWKWRSTTICEKHLLTMCVPVFQTLPHIAKTGMTDVWTTVDGVRIRIATDSTRTEKGKTMLNNPIKNDPLAMVWTAFKNLYPDKECDVWYDLHSNSGNYDGFAFTEFPPDGGTPQVVIYGEHGIEIQTEVFAHELAHVAVGEGKGHNKVWEAAFDAIFREYHRIGDSMFGGDGK
jgi:hypothetical protein